MLNRLFSKNLKYSFTFTRSCFAPSFYNLNFKEFTKKNKDKGRLSDSDSKRGAKASIYESETKEFWSSDKPEETQTPTNTKQIQTVEGHKVIFFYNKLSY